MGKIGNTILMAGMALLIMPTAQAQDDDPCAKFADSNQVNICKELIQNSNEAQNTFFTNNSLSLVPSMPGTADTTQVMDKTQILKYIFPPPPSKTPGVKRHDWPTPTKAAPKTKTQPNSDNQQPNIFQ